MINQKREPMKRGIAAVFGGAGPVPSALRETEGESVVPGEASSSAPPSKRRSGAAPEGKIKATYYIQEELIVRMRHLAVDLKIKDSDLVSEALRQIIVFYSNRNNV